MAVSTDANAVLEDWSKARAPIGRAGRKATRVFTVILDGEDSAARAPITARRATGIPRKNDTHPDDARLKVVNVDPRSKNSPLYWEVVISYEAKNVGTGKGSGTGEDSPLDQAALHNWSTASTVEAVEDDVDGKEIVNAAGDPFDPPLMREFKDTVLVISRYESSYNNPLITKIRDSTNSSILKLGGHGIGVGVALMKKITADEIIDGDERYFSFRYEIHFRKPNKERGLFGPTTWHRRIMNAGFQEILVDADGVKTLRRIVDSDGNFIAVPAPLTVAGAFGPPDADGNRKPNWLFFKMFPQADWSKLGLS